MLLKLSLIESCHNRGHVTHLGIQLPYLASGQLQENVFTLILKKKIMREKCYAYQEKHETKWKECPGHVVIKI